MNSRRNIEIEPDALSNMSGAAHRERQPDLKT